MSLELEKSFVNFNIGYASYLARGNPDEIPDNVVYYPYELNEAATFLRLSQDTWVVTCMTFCKVQHFTEYETVYEYAKQFPIFYDCIQKSILGIFYW
jgi:hypothetical protein